jgi:ferredoxin-NADP reductase
MQSAWFTLRNKILLTSDVFLLEFETTESLDFIAGQFITFLLPKTWFRRAYSVLQKQEKNWKFIVKRLENGRWGSKELCDLPVWTELSWIWPVWHFVISPEKNNKLFIATGTWIVPIYAILEKIFWENISENIGLIYGNTTQENFYYKDELEKFWEKIKNFEKIFCLSRENRIWYAQWRVTWFLDEKIIKKYDEFYICWNPEMVDDVRNILENFWIEKNKIFFEKY